MTLEQTVKRTFNRYQTKAKRGFDKIIDPLLVYVAGNALVIAAVDKAVDEIADADISKFENPIILGAYALGAAGIITANKYLMTPVAKKVYLHDKKLSRKRPDAMSYAGTLARIGATLGLVGVLNTSGAYEATKQRVSNIFGHSEYSTSEATDGGDTSISVNSTDMNKYSKNSKHGKFLRMVRWNRTVSQTEKKYNIPEGLLAGLGMVESSGDPTQLNYGGDGGAGLWQFQPGTARAYGLDIHGNSKHTGRDKKHGRDLRVLMESCNYDISKLAEQDERFNIPESTDAAARFIVDLHEKYGSWDKALSAYNRGRPARNPSKTSHVRHAREYQSYYLGKRDAYINDQ